MKIYHIKKGYDNKYLSYDLDKFLCFKSADINRITAKQCRYSISALYRKEYVNEVCTLYKGVC